MSIVFASEPMFGWICLWLIDSFLCVINVCEWLIFWLVWLCDYAYDWLMFLLVELCDYAYDWLMFLPVELCDYAYDWLMVLLVWLCDYAYGWLIVFFAWLCLWLVDVFVCVIMSMIIRSCWCLSACVFARLRLCLSAQTAIANPPVIATRAVPI